ncbi:MAG: hypothetical protein H7842_04035 [Gammaproteobacteria bacterium SHHR-1]|uniref:hypothetical protein n=1 Tax=Magnetovirga frankeli TaxID=947516 RepID=UPI001293F932|nr:hypothetical protein D5125_06465 [gamma proteobacterium SS-5]
MQQIPDFSETELWIINTTLKERYAQPPELQLADSEIRLHPSDREVSQVPAAIWQADECNFVIFKTGDRNYRGQFFYRLYQQYGTGVHEYDDLTECIVSLLQTQADYQAQDQGDIPEQRR